MGGSYAHPLPGLCPQTGTEKGSCSTVMPGVKSCLYMGGADEEDIARVQQDFAAMWGGAGHNVAHLIVGHGGKNYCM